MKEASWLIIAIIFMAVPYSLFSPTQDLSKSNQSSLSDCRTFYFFNGIYVYNSTIDEDLYLETPVNITLNEGFEQVVEHLVYFNTEYNSSQASFTFIVRTNESTKAFFISKVNICTRSYSMTFIYLNNALSNPSFTISTSREIPQEIRDNYLKTPHSKVVDLVVPAYESWFKENFNKNISEASLLGVAATASFFIYTEYINYTTSTLPRTIDEVIESRQGDCDDMSRVIVELLNYYGIPAVIVHGYTIIEGFKYPITVENVTYVFVNNGPHAFVMAYIPGLGWLSLDWLAGSFIVYSFIVESYTRSTDVPSEIIEEFLDLHKKLNATQVIGIFSEKSAEKLFGSPPSIEKILEYLDKQVNVQATQTTTNEIPTQTPTQSPSETPPQSTVHLNNTTISTTTPAEINIILALVITGGVIVVSIVIKLILKKQRVTS